MPCEVSPRDQVFIPLRYFNELSELKDLEASKGPPESIIDFMYLGISRDLYEVVLLFLANKELDCLLIDVQVLSDQEEDRKSR